MTLFGQQQLVPHENPGGTTYTTIFVLRASTFHTDRHTQTGTWGDLGEHLKETVRKSVGLKVLEKSWIGAGPAILQFRTAISMKLPRPDTASSSPGQTTRIVDAWGRERWARLDADDRLVEVVEPNPSGSGSVFAAGALATT